MKEFIKKGFIFFLAFLPVFSCDKGQDDGNFFNDIQLISDYHAFLEASANRSSDNSVPFSIENVSRNGNNLMIDVSYEGPDGMWSLIWNGEILESYPKQIWLILKLERNSTSASGNKNDKRLEINLEHLLGFTPGNEEVVLYISNGSSDQDITCGNTCDDVSSN